MSYRHCLFFAATLVVLTILGRFSFSESGLSKTSKKNELETRQRSAIANDILTIRQQIGPIVNSDDAFDEFQDAIEDVAAQQNTEQSKDAVLSPDLIEPHDSHSRDNRLVEQLRFTAKLLEERASQFEVEERQLEADQLRNLAECLRLNARRLEVEP